MLIISLTDKQYSNLRKFSTFLGIEGEEFDEISRGLTDIRERIEEIEKTWAEEKENMNKKADMEAKQAQEVRKLATERLGKTMERVGGNEPRKRKSPMEALSKINENLQAKRVQVDRELELRAREVEIRTQELEIARNQAAESRNFQQMQMQFMQQMQQQQNQMMKYMFDVLRSDKNDKQ